MVHFRSYCILRFDFDFGYLRFFSIIFLILRDFYDWSVLGRTKLRWEDKIKQDFKKLDLIMEQTQDKFLWKQLTSMPDLKKIETNRTIAEVVVVGLF